VKRPWRGARGPRSNISATLPLGSVGFEREPDANGERLIWLEPHVLDKPRPAPSRRKLQRRDPQALRARDQRRALRPRALTAATSRLCALAPCRGVSRSPIQRQRMAVKGACMKSARKPEPLLPRLNDPEYCRGRAEGARTIGERMIDGEARASLFRVAQQYKELGRKAEQRQIARLK
jgi:hypothetical protein